jgi:hypothetical protein
MAQNKIDIKNFILLNRRGFNCSLGWKYKLIKKGQFPYEISVEKDKTFVILNNKK